MAEKNQLNWQTIAAISAVLLSIVGYVISIESRVTGSKGSIQILENRLFEVETKTREFYSSVKRLIATEVEKNLKDEAIKETERKANQIYNNLEKIYNDSLEALSNKNIVYNQLIEKSSDDVLKKHNKILGYHASISTLYQKSTKAVENIEKMSPGTIHSRIDGFQKEIATLKEKQISIYKPIKYARSGYPRNGTFVSKGGKLLIFASGTAYSKSKDTLMVINIYLDEHIIGSLQSLTNEGYSHKTLTSDIIVLTGIKPGSHIIEMKFSNPTKLFADKNDLSQITVVELP